jgi:hypothetical protein
MRQAWTNLFKGPANFFKHGRYDEDGARYEFDPHLSEVLLMACVKGLSQMGLVIAPPELALTYWQYFTLPAKLRTSKMLMESPKVEFIQELARKGREVYFREFMAAADGGLIVAGGFDLPTPPNPAASAE